MTTDGRLPQSFLRGLEADLRALCADARRKNPQVKEAAERVILSLKEADTPELEIQAADSAAAAFCTTCEPPGQNLRSTALSLHIKVVLRAVTSLHKLLTHRALSSARLPLVLDALQRLASSCIDDTITLKVLQGLLSLLTVRSYAKSLSEDDLSRAFSLLFILKTSRSPNASNPASNALSAISQMSSTPDLGVIEQTSKAAFRQASSDLFASAADAAVQTAVRLQAPSGEFISLDEFPTEARAAYRFFMDLCNAAAGEPLAWMSHMNSTSQSLPADLDPILALEVIDDSLASNIGLFAAQPVFSDVLSKHLCPVIHKLLQSSLDKSASKSLFALIVTVVRHYWRNLNIDSQSLLLALAAICQSPRNRDADPNNWTPIYAIEALRCIFRSQASEPNAISDFVRAFELSEWSKKPITAIVKLSCEAMNGAKGRAHISLPSLPITGSMKPFAKTITMSNSFFIAAATGLYLDLIKGVKDALSNNSTDVATVILDTDTTHQAVGFLGLLIESNPFTNVTAAHRHTDSDVVDPLDVLPETLSSIIIVAHACHLKTIREKAFVTLAGVCARIIRNLPVEANPSPDFIKRVSNLYGVLFDVIMKCQESLGRSWNPAVEAFEVLDSLIQKIESAGEKGSPALSSVIVSLKPRLEDVFKQTRNLKWVSCHDMISALVQCSRQSMASLSKRVASEDLSIAEVDPNLRVFGITGAEIAILNAFQRTATDIDPMPSTLWELLTGHLTSVCADSSIYSLRLFALQSLTRIACGAIPTADAPIVAHEKIVTPFLDLFNSTHADVRSGSLSSLYTILESQGERLKGEAAWRSVLNILTTAAGSKAIAKVKDTSSAAVEHSHRTNPQRSSTSIVQGDDMISEGFKVVQVIADDFLSSLATNSLPAWLEVIGLYCRQEDDINVALTSIGLLWRTADFVAKSCNVSEEDWLWVEVFQLLKDVSMDERPEIRNCAVKTLTGALTAHSFRLSARAWSGCAERALLPLLEEVMKGGINSNQGDENAANARGRADSQVMWHHSRDTPRKQWNETRVLALSGVAKVLRSAMPRLAVLEDKNGRPLFLMLTDGGANGLWRKMLRAAGVAAASRDREVAIAGASALLELLSAAGFVVGDQREHLGAGPGFDSSVSAPASLGGVSKMSWMGGASVEANGGQSDENGQERISQDDNSTATNRKGTVMLWEAVWSALTEAIGGGEVLQENSNDTLGDTRIVDEKALQMLAEGLIESRNKLSDTFTPGSSKMLVRVLMYLAVGSKAPGDSSATEIGLTDVQEVTLKGLKSLSFGSDAESWTGLVQGLLSAVPNRRNKSERDVVFIRRVFEILRTLYTGNTMLDIVKSTQLRGVLPVLGGILLERKQIERGSYSEPERAGSVDGTSTAGEKDERTLWKLSCDVLISTMSQAQEKASSGASLDTEWGLFADLLDQFLFDQRPIRSDIGHHQGERNERELRELYDIKLVECVSDGLRRMRAETGVETKRKLVRVISKGAEEGEMSGRRRFVRMCQKKLFLLADGTTGEHEDMIDVGIVEECGQHVVETCSRVLGQYIADGQRGGRCPLPASRRAEAVFLLRQLRRKLWCGDGSRREEASRKQVLALNPRLCECVESQDEAVRVLARELLDETSTLASGISSHSPVGSESHNRLSIAPIRDEGLVMSAT